jgi:hypothetical protein
MDSKFRDVSVFEVMGQLQRRIFESLWSLVERGRIVGLGIIVLDNF